MRLDRSKLDALLEERGWRYRDLAKAAGLTQEELSVALNPTLKRPRRLAQICQALKVPVEAIISSDNKGRR